MATVAGQPSYILRTGCVEAAITQRAAMLAPVAFYRDTPAPIQPYSISPWAEEKLDPQTPPILVCLRGDFICSAFGGNDEPFNGQKLPVHGETANEVWETVSAPSSEAGAVLHMTMQLRLQGGRCDHYTALVEGHNVVYQRDDFSGIDGPINPGHHATLKFPDRRNAGRLSFSKHIHAHTFIEPFETPDRGGYSILRPDTPIADLAAVPCVDGTVADVSAYPARAGYEDIVIICADPSLDVAWSAVTFADDGYVWFSLRNPALLPSTLLWMSNGGRKYAPWNGRHINVMGIEDMTGFFHVGLAASARENLLTRKGVKTCHQIKPSETLRIPYIQGVTRIRDGFDRVVAVEIENDATIVLIAASGVQQTVPCQASFLRSGRLTGLIE